MAGSRRARNSATASRWKRLVFLAYLATSTHLAAQGANQAELYIPKGLGVVDWCVIVAYLGGMLAIGPWVAKRQSGNADYFTAARSPINPILVGISLYAALLSTISYLGKPGEMISKGPVAVLGQVLAVPFAYVVVAYFLIPRIMQHRVTSAYELLERRLGTLGRLLGAILFIKLRLVWMALMVYVSSTAIAVILGVDLKYVPLVSLVVAIVPLTYTSMGGLRAVVLANVIQFFLLLGGAIATILVVTIRCGGFGWWPAAWAPNWDNQPVFSFDPYVRVTVFSATLSMLLWRVCTAGGDQMAIQHYMATKDIRATRRSYLINSIATLVVTIILGLVGLALLGYFKQFPASMAAGLNLDARADHLFPFFVANLLPVGISGLVVAAIMAASSGMDTGVNAVAAVVTKDFLDRFGWLAKNEARRLKFTKALSFAIGLVVVGASLLVSKVPGNFVEMTSKLSNLETTTIFCLFFFALFVPCATGLGALMGALYGLAATILVAFWDVITGRQAISFLYIGVIGLVVNLSVGYVTSRFGPRNEDRRASLRVGTLLSVVLAVGVTVIVSTSR